MEYDARQVLSDFLVRDRDKMSEREWCRIHGLRPHDVRKARSLQVGISIDKLQEFAKALEVEPWMLLFPGFERNANPFPAWSGEAIDIATELDKIPDEAQRLRAYAAIVKVLEMAGLGQAVPETLVEPPKPSPDTMRLPAKAP